MKKVLSFVKSYLFPFGALIFAIVLILVYNVKITHWTVIAGGLEYLGCVIWLHHEVYEDTDNQWWPSALTLVFPFLVGIINNENLFR